MPISIDREFARIVKPIVERVHADAALLHAGQVPPSEMEALIYCVLRHFDGWSQGKPQQLDVCVALIQNVCFVRSIPLFEAAEVLYAIRDCVMEDLKLERLRSDGEAHHSEAGRYFDLLVFELLKGY